MSSIPTRSRGRKLPPAPNKTTQAAIDATDPTIKHDTRRFYHRRIHASYNPANHTATQRQCRHCGLLQPLSAFYANGKATYRPECKTCHAALRESRYGKRCARCGDWWQYGKPDCPTCELQERETICAKWLLLPLGAFQAWYRGMGLELEVVEKMIRERQRRMQRRYKNSTS